LRSTAERTLASPLGAERTARWPQTLVSGTAAALAFAALAWATQKGLTQRFDWEASWAVHASSGAWLTAGMVMITTLAEPAMAVAFSVWVGWMAFRRGDGRGCAVALGTVWVAGALNYVLKAFFHRARPDLWSAQGAQDGFGFPSWHALAAVAVGGTLALVLGRLYPGGRRLLGAGVALLALLIGVSRVYLGLHWTTDVLAGGCVGWLLLLVAASALEARPFRAPPTR
jgi:undecaprenyl-diphosphatase